MLKAAIPSVVLYAPYTHNPTRFQHDYPKMKQTKIVLMNYFFKIIVIINSTQSDSFTSASK